MHRQFCLERNVLRVNNHSVPYVRSLAQYRIQLFSLWRNQFAQIGHVIWPQYRPLTFCWRFKALCTRAGWSVMEAKLPLQITPCLACSWYEENFYIVFFSQLEVSNLVIWRVVAFSKLVISGPSREQHASQVLMLNMRSRKSAKVQTYFSHVVFLEMEECGRDYGVLHLIRRV